MDKYIYDDKNGLWYELQGDYYIPCLILLKTENALEWTQRMNNIQACAKEIIEKEIIFA